MLSSRTTARARKSAGGAIVRSSRRRSSISACSFSSAMAGRIAYADLSSERDQTRTHRPGKIGVGDRAEPEERAVMLDRRRGVAALVGDDREVVVRARIARIDGERAPKQTAGVGHAPSRFLDE